MVSLVRAGVWGGLRPGTSGEMAGGRKSGPKAAAPLEGLLTGLGGPVRRPPQEGLSRQGPVRQSGRGAGFRRGASACGREGLARTGVNQRLPCVCSRRGCRETQNSPHPAASCGPQSIGVTRPPVPFPFRGFRFLQTLAPCACGAGRGPLRQAYPAPGVSACHEHPAPGCSPPPRFPCRPLGVTAGPQTCRPAVASWPQAPRGLRSVSEVRGLRSPPGPDHGD